MFATPVGFTYGAIVHGRRPIDVTIAPAETNPYREGVFEDFGSAAAGQ